MAKQVSQSTVRMDVQAAGIVYVEATADLDENFVQRIIDLAEVSSDKSSTYVDRQIRAQVRSYLTGEAIASRHLSSSEGRKALRNLDRSFEKIATTLHALSIEQRFVLDELIKRADGKADAPGLVVACTRLNKLREAVANTAEIYKPKTGNPELGRLELAVGALMLLFEQASGNRAKVAMTKNGEHDPRCTSPQAQAITTLMTSIDPSLDARTVVTKIHKIGREHRGKPLYRFAPALWLPMQEVQPTPATPAEI